MTNSKNVSIGVSLRDLQRRSAQVKTLEKALTKGRRDRDSLIRTLANQGIAKYKLAEAAGIEQSRISQILKETKE